MIVPVIMKEATVTGWPGMKRSDWNKAKKEAWRRVGFVWLRKMLPRHFRAGAAARYGYDPRTAQYLKQKRRRVGHIQPLLLSGILKRQVLSPARQRVAATSKNVTIRLRHDPRTSTVHAELVKVTASEVKELQSLYHQELAKILEAYTGQKKVPIR